MSQGRAALHAASIDSGSETDPDGTVETVRTVTRPLPRVLVVHTGGTLGMDPGESYHIDATGKPVLAAGTGGKYSGGLRPGASPWYAQLRAAHRCPVNRAMPGPRAEIAQVCAGTMLKSLLKVCHLPSADQHRCAAHALHKESIATQHRRSCQSYPASQTSI